MTHAYRADTVGISGGTLAPSGDPDAFERSVRAAAGAGFPSMVLATGLVTRHGVDAATRLLDDCGIAAPVTEAAMTWFAGPEAASADASEHLDVASALGARILQACALTTALDSFPRAVEGFATLCERAAEHDMVVAIEFVPFTAIPDLATAWGIVRESGAPNGGVCLDFLHFERQPGGPDRELLATIPGAHIPYVQVCDARPDAPESRKEYFAQAMGARELPGDGVVDIPGLMDALAAQDADPYFAFEVFSSEMQARGADEMARWVYASTPRCFATAE
jgi:sugar phosphate isomerase/epimerase